MKQTIEETYQTHIQVQLTSQTRSQHLDLLVWLFFPNPKDTTLLQLAWLATYVDVPRYFMPKYS